MVAKQPVVLTVNDLKNLLGIPEDVEIVDIGFNRMYGLGQIEFTLMSSEPIEGLTREYPPDAETIRRMGINSIKIWREKQND